MSVFLLVVSSSIVGCLVYKLMKIVSERLKYNEQVKWLPGPKALPIIGNAIQLISLTSENRMQTIEKWRKEFADIFLIWVGWVPSVVIQQADALQALLKSPVNINKSMEYKFVQDFLGDGLLTSSGEKWHSRRRMLTPCFHLDILDQNIVMVQKNAGILMSKFKPYSDSGTPCKISEYIRCFALDVIMDTSIGKTINAQDNPTNPYFKAINTMCEILLIRTFSPILKYDIFFNLSSYKAKQNEARDTLRNFSLQAIQARKESRRQDREASDKNTATSSGKKRLALMDKLLELNENEDVLSDEDIREEIDTFVFAGHDTTTSAITFILFILGHHPEVQEKILKEVNEKIPDFTTRTLTIKDLNSLEYLDMAIKEAMRVYPPVPFIGRDLSEAIQTPNGTIPAGQQTIISIYTTHTNPNHFKDPLKYDPERFNPENRDQYPIFAYIPFSAGSRNCIGQKLALSTIKTLTITTLLTYKIKSVQRREDITLVANAIMESKPPIEIQFSTRNP